MKRWMYPIGTIEHRVGFVFAGIQNSSGGGAERGGCVPRGTRAPPVGLRVPGDRKPWGGGGDDRNVTGEENTTDGYGFTDSREDLGPRPLKSLKRLSPHGGRQLSWYCRRVRHGGVLTMRV